MNQGALIFAHNNADVDYGLMAIISGGLAKKNLKIPVSLVTDKWTLAWLGESNMLDVARSVFDKIIEIEKPITSNVRKLHDGFHGKIVPFVNSNRCSAWDLSPYDKTLLLDSDYLIFSNTLNAYWEVDTPIMMSHSMNDIVGNRSQILDQRVSETGIHMFWATTVMFDNSPESQFFFKLVDYIKDNYAYYADLFRFNPKQYRNDIAFSVAKHIINGFETEFVYTLPPVLTVFDKDILHNVDASGKLTFLIDMPHDCGNFWGTTTLGMDVHVMNKQSIIRNKEQLLALI
jgi:hypothetical protein